LVAVTNAVAFVRGFGETALHLVRPQHLIIANRPFLSQIEAVPEHIFTKINILLHAYVYFWPFFHRHIE